MKKLISVSLAAMMILSLLCACGGPSAELTFKGSYQPQQTEGAEAVQFELTLYSDGTLKVTPGLMFGLDDKDATKIVHDDPATGTWKKNADESITMTITDTTMRMKYSPAGV